MGAVVLDARWLTAACLQQLIPCPWMSGLIVSYPDFWDVYSGKGDCKDEVHWPLGCQEAAAAAACGEPGYPTPHDELNNLTCTFVCGR